jgi:hypothetical protein
VVPPADGGQEFISVEPEVHMASCTGTVRCRKRLGGLLRYYYRQAA